MLNRILEAQKTFKNTHIIISSVRYLMCLADNFCRRNFIIEIPVYVLPVQF